MEIFFTVGLVSYFYVTIWETLNGTVYCCKIGYFSVNIMFYKSL